MNIKKIKIPCETIPRCGVNPRDSPTVAALTAAGLDVPRALADNDAYHALQAVGGLIMTGPTGTNVNDVAVVLTE